jgi:7,8-dihydro-6-hydroxymethylpterin-pyrophosphokinase
MQEIESVMGRDRARSVDRPVDLDLLYYDDLVLSAADLLLPHPEIQARRFVLVPLAELAPDLRHPALGLTTSQMLQRLGPGDEGEIQRLAWVEKQGLSAANGKACR